MQLTKLEMRVLVLAPTKADAEVTLRVLAETGIDAQPCDSAELVSRELLRGAGALIVTDEDSRHDAISDCAFCWSASLPGPNCPF